MAFRYRYWAVLLLCVYALNVTVVHGRAIEHSKTSVEDTPFGQLSDETKYLFALVSQKVNLIRSSNQELVIFDKELSAFWQDLEQSQSDLINYMQSIHNQPNLPAPSNLNTSLWLCLLSKLPGGIVESLSSMGMPSCKINDHDIAMWRDQYLNKGLISSAKGDIYSFEKYADLDAGWMLAPACKLAVKLGILPKALFNPYPAVYR